MTGHRNTSRAIAIVTIVWLMASLAALALATTSDDVAVAQQGCKGGGSSASPSQSASPSPSESEGFPPTVPSIPPSVVPGEQKADAPAPPPAMDPWKKVPVAAAQQDVSCKSTITIAYRSSGKQAFTGKVGSGEPMCKRARKVTIKKVKKGTDPTVARAVTNAKGSYTAPEPNARGKFYAQVAKSTTENDDGESVTCQPARSETIRP